MTTEQLYNELKNVNHSKEKRLQYALLILNEPELASNLLDILFMVDDKLSCKAAWVLEYTCGKNLQLLIPYLNRFTEHIPRIHLDPAVRPVAKICEYLALAYTDKINTCFKNALTQTHKDRIIETCFDYLINDEKVAPKAYSMNTLFLLGKETDWVYPELRNILERDFEKESAAFKARARHILKKLKKV